MASGVIKAMASVTDVRDLANVIQKATTSQPDSLSSLKTDLDAIAMTIGNNETINLKVVPSFSSDGFSSSINYRGFLHKTSSSTFTSFLSEDTSGTGIVISRTASTWGFNRLVGYNDSEYAALRSSIAIVSNGNTHSAISSGQYIYIYNHSTLADGIYKATSAIAGNASLTSSNVSAVPNGLGDAVSTIETHLSDLIITKTYSASANRSASAGGLISIGANEYKDSSNNSYAIPTGYIPIGFTYEYPGSGNVSLSSVDLNAEGTEILIIYKAQNSMSSTSMTSHITVTFMKT